MASKFPNTDEGETHGEHVINQSSGKLYSFELENYTLSLLVIGAAGTGKSMFCNFLSKMDHFKESEGVESVTDRIEHCVKEIADEKILIVDSPGFNDPMKSDEEIFENISETAILTRDGVDAVVIVVNPSERFSNSDRKALEKIGNLGGNLWDHGFIIFRNAQRIESKLKKRAEEYIEQLKVSTKCPKELKEMLELVGGRYICVESVDRSGDEKYWQSKSKEIVDMIKSLKEQNKGARYKNEIMKMGAEGYKRVQILEGECLEMKKRMNELENSKNQMRSGLETLYEKKINELERSNAEILKLTSELMKLHLEKKNEVKREEKKEEKKGSGCCIM